MTHHAGHLIRSARHAKSITQRDLAAQVGLNFTYISKIEHGTSAAPSDFSILRLADALDIDRDALFVAFAKIPPDIVIQLRGNAELTQQIRQWLAPPDRRETT